jgi:hypothetical protein
MIAAAMDALGQQGAANRNVSNIEKVTGVA